MTITMTLSRTDFERVNNTLGIIALLAGRELDEAEPGDLRTMLFQIVTVMPPSEAKRLMEETDRQFAAQGVAP
jgi:hypothetical protein